MQDSAVVEQHQFASVELKANFKGGICEQFAKALTGQVKQPRFFRRQVWQAVKTWAVVNR